MFKIKNIYSVLLHVAFCRVMESATRWCYQNTIYFKGKIDFQKERKEKNRK